MPRCMLCVFIHFEWPGSTLGALFCVFFTDLSQVFLYTCIMCRLAKLRPWRKLCCYCECKRNCLTAKEIYQGLFISLTFIVLVGAFGVSYRCQPQTNRWRQKTPVTKTKTALFWGFSIGTIFGSFLSSFGVLMATIVVMFLSSEPV